MFPLIPLFSSLIILVGQIPGYSASGGESSSTAEHQNPVEKVKQLLYPNPEDASRSYLENIKLAGQLFKQMGQTETYERDETEELLYRIWTLSRLEEQLRSEAVIQCDSDVRWAVVETRKLIDRASDKNEFSDEPAEHPLNKMINDYTDILFEACSIDINDRINQLRTSRYADKAKNEVKFALINLDRFRKFLKLPKDPVRFNLNNLPYSFLAFEKTLIDLNTELEPEDLEFLGVPQENTLSRNELIQRLVERTCDRIVKDDSAFALFVDAEEYARDAYDIYKQTSKGYYFRAEIAHFKICSSLASLVNRPQKKNPMFYEPPSRRVFRY